MNRLATDSTGAENISTQANIGVTGCQGRVAKLVVKELQSKKWGPNIHLAGGTVKPGYPKSNEFLVSEDPDDIFQCSDVIIDFTTPEATSKHIWLAAKHHKPLVIGTTGLTDAQEQEISDASKETAIVYSANMSIGINLIKSLIQTACSILAEDYDIEISEIHHKHKVDSPSGTALELGKSAALGRGVDFDTHAVYSRDGITGERERGNIGFSVQRGGDIVGTHTLSLFGEGEHIALSHTATDRSLFAKGAIRAAIWLKDQPYGLYSMNDVLNI
jgi:4-hydroxy-tetrahydrodipicolinate reductase